MSLRTGLKIYHRLVSVIVITGGLVGAALLFTVTLTTFYEVIARYLLGTPTSWYLDYGIYQPIQIASIIALNGPQDCVEEIRLTYKERRDALISGLERIGWSINCPKGTMFVWGKIPEQYVNMGSVEFSKFMIKETKVAVSPGLGFGEYGDDYVRFALIENKMRINQAVRGIRNIM